MSTFHYEQTDPERFQMLAQSLMLEDYPDLQAFPVGQKDGGRDGVAERQLNGPARTILQVKFKRSNDKAGGTADWMISTLERELPKIVRLIEAGAQRYVMVTNAMGTSIPDSGSIDRVDQWLSDNLTVPAVCFWRESVDRRLESSLALQWRYPEVLDGPAALRLALEVSMGDGAARRTSALQQFVTLQHNRDAKVKFKQVDMSNDLFDLFIDVPAELQSGFALTKRDEKHWTRQAHMYAEYMINSLGAGAHGQMSSGQAFDTFFASSFRNLPPVGIARTLLDARFQEKFPWVVLEGAPGQGKSTLAQYVCQVHRAKYLNRADTLSKVPPAFTKVPVRLPIKVDLRDLAAWINGRNAFVPGEPALEEGWIPTLQAFLAHQISFQSGGLVFDTFDLLACLSAAPSLLFLDGLDEVADISTRRRLIDVVNDGLGQLEASGADLQVVITSRPAVFENSPGFKSIAFTYLRLSSIDSDLVQEYAEKWVVARQLDESDATEVKTVLAAKLDLDHIRDLTRNPMQLAILLALIHSVGYSLPDQRTELYASYIDRFMTREAEKSPSVREHRQLLLKVHQYLAWRLQTEVEEESGGSGSLSAIQLRSVIESYLVANEHDVRILNELFTGLLERVFVLVQRIEGMYEFEVQPLREYFCAKYIYEATPTHVEPGGDGTVSRVARFEVLARNPYWTNVVRFLGGCFTSGELGGVYFQLQAMIEDPEFATTYRPREVGWLLLSDWVFRESPRVTKAISSQVFDDLGIAGVLTHYRVTESFRVGSSMTLPPECGRESLIEQLFIRLLVNPSIPSANEISRLIQGNGGLSYSQLADLSESLMSSTGKLRTRWIQICCLTGHSEILAETYLYGDQPNEDEAEDRSRILLSASAIRAQSLPRVAQMLVAGILDGRGVLQLAARSHWISRLSQELNVTASAYRVAYGADVFRKNGADGPILGHAPSEVEVFLNLRSAVPDGADWSSNLQTWIQLESDTREAFGDCRALLGNAVLAGHVKPDRPLSQPDNEPVLGVDTYSQYSVLARRKSGASRWWSHVLKQPCSTFQRIFLLLAATYWCGPATLIKLKEDLSESIASLADEDFKALHGLARAISAPPRETKRRGHLASVENLKEFQSVRLAIIVAELENRVQNLGSAYPDERTQYRVIDRQCTLSELSAKYKSASDPLDQADRLRNLSMEFAQGAVSIAGLDGHGRVTPELRREILATPLDFPAELVSIAEASQRAEVSVTTVGAVARQQRWKFE